ncbi:hypothetical protein [Candidatus Formimonas warabiya]|uniref:Uncharacterized protein n=1 Tax=Formimonas warabiya TaxID=1761012 RepID=A0A3G1KLX6_FORW1|nr:hypothetical protein [Candidatus Formimonas warabiya]ATW23431.1 hypothetical protein DCMF_00245 [Candidatus Formimonas warabiya]
MTKRNKVFRIAFLLLVLSMVSTVMISGTFAKYTSEYAGQDTALVARWDFQAYEGTTGLGDPDADPVQQLDLFKHEYDVHINQADGVDYIIAPGVNDEFTIKMSFLSDVDATVTVGFTKTADVATDNLPIEYSVDNGTTWVSLTGLANAFAEKVDLAVDGDGDPINTKVTAHSGNTFTFEKSGIDDAAATVITQVVKWRWAFDTAEQGASYATGLGSSDTVDTGFGNTSADGGATRTTYVLNVSVKADQIQPTTI